MWEELEVQGDVSPFPIEGAKCAMVSHSPEITNMVNPNKTSIYLFGGYGRYSLNDNSLYELCLNKYSTSTDVDRWQTFKVEKKHTEKQSTDPPATSHHSLTYVPNTNCLYLYGGTSSDKSIYEWNLEFKEWKSWLPLTIAPEVRQEHAACVLQNQIYVFGGRSPKCSDREYADLWRFDPITHEWILLSAHDITSRLSHPKKRYGHILLADEMNKYLYLVGGCSENTPLKEIWRYEIDKKEWLCLTFNFPDSSIKSTTCSVLPHRAPLYIPARYGSGVLVGELIICLGGETLLDYDEGTPVLNDLLIFNTRTNCIKLTGIASSNTHVCYHDLFLLRDQLLLIGGRIQWPFYYNHINALRPYGNIRDEFGISIKSIATVPQVFDECIEYLMKNGCEVEGIFRVSPPKRDVDAVVMRYEMGANTVITSHLNTLSEDCHIVAGVLKYYLKSLPEPLMTFDINDQLVELFSHEPQDMLVKVKSALSKLPYQNKQMLQQLINLLVKVDAHANKNSMNVNNLARILCGTLFKAKPGPNPSQIEQQQDIPAFKCVEYLIKEHKRLF